MLDSSIKIVSKEEYKNAYNNLQDFCIKNMDSLIIGEFGDPSCPSISDLDVFICLKDENFESKRIEILNFIDGSSIRRYLFFHDPFIISEEMLPFVNDFHSLYNLSITYNPKNLKIPKASEKSSELLNIIWTSFLMVIGVSIIVNNTYSIRDKLLVLKNICQSIVNIDSDSDALKFSLDIRVKVLKGDLTADEVNEVFIKKLKELFRKTNKIEIQDLENYGLRKKYKIKKNQYLIASEHNSFSIDKESSTIFLNETFFELFKQFYYKKTKNIEIQNIMLKANTLSKIVQTNKTIYPFISPFCFQFFRKDIKFVIKKIVYSF